MWKNRLAILLPLSALLALEAAPLAAQYIPGGSHRENQARFDERFAEFRRRALADVTEAMDEWENAWMDGDLEEVSDAYTEDAVLSPPGGGKLARSHAEIVEYLGELVANTDRFSTDVLDFEVDDRTAHVLGRFELRPEEVDGVYAGTRRGLFMTIFRRERGGWKIRSQLFRLDA